MPNFHNDTNVAFRAAEKATTLGWSCSSSARQDFGNFKTNLAQVVTSTYHFAQLHQCNFACRTGLACPVVFVCRGQKRRDWMRCRLYASSFVDHSSYSNFHGTASLQRIDELSSIFCDIRLSDLVSKEAKPRPVRIISPYIHFCAQDLQGLNILETILFKWVFSKPCGKTSCWAVAKLKSRVCLGGFG